MFTALYGNRTSQAAQVTEIPVAEPLPTVDLMYHIPTSSLIDMDTGSAVAFFKPSRSEQDVAKEVNTLAWLAVNKTDEVFTLDDVMDAVVAVTGIKRVNSRQPSRWILADLVENGFVDAPDHTTGATWKKKTIPSDASLKLSARYSVSVDRETNLDHEQRKAVLRQQTAIKGHLNTPEIRRFEKEHGRVPRSAARVLYGLVEDPTAPRDSAPAFWTLGSTESISDDKIISVPETEKARVIELFTSDTSPTLASHKEAILVLDVLLSDNAAHQIFDGELQLPNERRNQLIAQCQRVLGWGRFNLAWGSRVHAGGLKTGARRTQIRQTAGSGSDTTTSIRFLLGTDPAKTATE